MSFTLPLQIKRINRSGINRVWRRSRSTAPAMREALRIGLIGGLLLTLLHSAQAAVTVKTVMYNGWKGAVQMSNGTVEVVVVPQIGRIMRYGFAGGPNVLWNNAALAGKTTDLASAGKDWNNYGGDKLWPAPQDRWGWPPDRTLDSAPQTIQKLPNGHLLLTGQASKALGIQFRREIALEATGTAVTLTNTLVNTGTEDVDWAIWEVAQIDDPVEARLSLNKQGHFPTGYRVWGDDPLQPEQFEQTETQLIMKRSPKTSAKVGADAPNGQLEALVGTVKFTFSAPYEIGATYSDQGCAQQIYTNPDPAKYMEMELLGPILPLKPKGTRKFVTHWSLTK